jgi:hypothetical protein
MFKGFYHQIGMNVAFTSIYHPQSNSAVERANTLIFEAIKKILESEKNGKWSEVMLHAIWSHNTTVSMATNFIPFRLLFGAETILLEEINHKSFWTTMEAPTCPNEVEDKDLLELDRLKAVVNLQKIPSRNRGMEISESQTKGIWGQGSSSLAESLHRELLEIGIKMGWAICGHGKVEAMGVLPLRYTRKNVGAFVECV